MKTVDLAKAGRLPEELEDGEPMPFVTLDLSLAARAERFPTLP